MLHTLEECLEISGISIRHYLTVINALAQVCTQNGLAPEVDPSGWSHARAVVERIFGKFVLRAENRGSAYAIWITTVTRDGGLRKVVFFDEVPWTQEVLAQHASIEKVNPAGLRSRNTKQSERHGRRKHVITAPPTRISSHGPAERK